MSQVGGGGHSSHDSNIQLSNRFECGSVASTKSARHTEGGHTEVTTNIPLSDGPEVVLRDARQMKRDLLRKICEITTATLEVTNEDDVSAVRDKIVPLEREMDQFFCFLDEKSKVDFPADFGEHVMKEFGNLKCKLGELEEQHCTVGPEDSISNVSTVSGLSKSSSCALAQIDIELKRKELHFEAKQAQFESRDAQLQAEKMKLSILSRSGVNSQAGSMKSSFVGSHRSNPSSHLGLPCVYQSAKRNVEGNGISPKNNNSLFQGAAFGSLSTELSAEPSKIGSKGNLIGELNPKSAGQSSRKVVPARKDTEVSNLTFEHRLKEHSKA